MKGSRRSRGRSSTRSREPIRRVKSPREKVADCCRKVIAFMCTQVGVGGLIVGYAVLGALGFMHLEHDFKRPEVDHIMELRSNVTLELWDLVQEENTFNETIWRNEAQKILKSFQEGVAYQVKNKGYNGKPHETNLWTFPSSLMFCLSVFTMIGFGNTVPRTPAGKVCTVIYAVFGIPLYVLYFLNMGKVLASVFKWFYRKLVRCTSNKTDDERVIVPSTACLWVLGAYIATGTVMFAVWEKWRYIDSVYFCVTSLCKLGIGDFVPGEDIGMFEEGDETKLVINFIYLLIGMGLIAMCYNLLREVIRVKIQDIKEDILLCFEEVRLRMIACYGVEEPEED